MRLKLLGPVRPMSFDAIYYSGPSPSSLHSLTMLGLVFDRLIFPGVFVPSEGVDEAETQKEIDRVAKLGPLSMDTAHMLNLMTIALNARYLSDFCVFPGKYGYPGVLESGAEELARELELQIYGPPPEGFTPTISLGFAKRVPGTSPMSVNGPSWIAYPANALLYASHNQMLLVNDNPRLPVPAVGGSDVRSNAQQLATILALESVKLVLPNLRPLSFEELAEFRQDTRESAQPFRRAMLRLSKDLNQAILSDSPLEEVQKEAKFLVETTVLPELANFRDELSRPSRPWHRRAFDLIKNTPELVGAFATLPTNVAFAKVLVALGDVLTDIRDSRLEREGAGKRGGFHYLLRAEKLNE